MAVINSVFTGAARNKVGEVTTAIIHGRTIAKKYQPNVANPKTAAQVARRNMLANLVMIFAYFAPVVKRSYPRRRSYVSDYNQFVSLNVESMPIDRPQGNIADQFAALATAGSSLILADGGLPAPSSSFVKATGVMTVTLPSDLTLIPVGSIVRGFCMSDLGICRVAEHVLTSAELTAGTCTIQLASVATNAMSGAYIALADRSNVSTMDVPVTFA